ncbi:MAG: PLDc N-terminal domain-containing protein [Alphaproteobacteria bacterium]
MGDFGGGLVGLILLILVVWAVVSILQSSAGTGAKVLWIVLVLILPFIGFIIWLLAGPKKAAVV